MTRITIPPKNVTPTPVIIQPGDNVELHIACATCGKPMVATATVDAFQLSDFQYPESAMLFITDEYPTGIVVCSETCFENRKRKVEA